MPRRRSLPPTASRSVRRASVAPADPAAPKKPTRATRRRFVEETVDFLNEKVATLGRAHESMANEILKRVFDGDPLAALAAEKSNNWRYVELRSRADATLHLSRQELSNHVRIGALNEVLEGEAWGALQWSKKVALLSLLARKEEALPAIRRGASYSLKPKVTVRALRKWVDVELHQSTDENALAIRSGARAVAGTVNLADPERRDAFVTAARAAPLEKRVEIADDLRAGIAALKSLLDDIEGE